MKDSLVEIKIKKGNKMESSVSIDVCDLDYAGMKNLREAFCTAIAEAEDLYMAGK